MHTPTIIIAVAVLDVTLLMLYWLLIEGHTL